MPWFRMLLNMTTCLTANVRKVHFTVFGHSALGITGAVLSFVGYVPEVAQTAKAMFGIRLLLGPIPALIFILSLVMLYFYPINEQRYNEILDDIKKMEAKKT
jgi:Na+/melibiose symporter-like transporter